MGDLEKIIEEIYEDDPKLYPLCSDIGSRISRNELKLVAVVEALGPKLTDKDAMTRSKSMNILAAVFASFQPDLLSEAELSFIVEFLHDRLRDQHVVIPRVIHCIKAIISCKNLPEGAAGKLLLQLFKEANIQSHIHKDRHAYFLILSYILDAKINEIDEWKSDFVMYFIQSMDGEKDPRNLLLIFRLVPTIINEFPITNFVEDLFEVLSCYFPVDFSPTITGKDEEIITREDLSSALHLCLSHSNQFAPFLIPLVIDKLESNLMSSKLDSMKLLELCCQRSYQPADLEPFLPSLWRVLSKEIFLGGNESVNTEILQLVTATFQALSKSPTVLSKTIDMVFGECKHHLMEPELRLMQPASSILISIAKASEASCTLIVTKVLPLLYEQFLAKSTTSERKAILEFFNRIVAVGKTFPVVKLPTLLSKWEEILATLFNLLSHKDSEFVNLSLQFYQLTLSDLDSKSVSTLDAHLLNLIAGPTMPTDETRRCIMSCLDSMANHFPESVATTTVHGLLKTADSLECRDDFFKLEIVLAALAEASYVVAVAQVALPALVNRVELKSVQAISTTEDISYHLQRLLAYCNCIHRVVEKGISRRCPSNDSSTKEELSKFLDLVVRKLNIVSVITDIAVKIRVVQYETEDLQDVQVQIYSVSTEISRSVVRAADEKLQEEILSVFSSQQVSDVHGLVMESVVGSLRRTVSIPDKAGLMQRILDTLVSLKEASCRLDSIDAMARIRLFATLLNKIESTDELRDFENKVQKIAEDIMSHELTNGCQSDKPLVNGAAALKESRLDLSVELVVWTVKSLAVRGADAFESWLERVISMLGTSTVGCILADKFEVLLEDCPYSLNISSHCIYRFLYKQRIFLSSVPKLVSAYKEAKPEDPVRVNYIRALSCQLRHVSQNVLHMELNNVLPLLVASLTCEESSIPIRKSCLDALLNLLNDSGQESPLVPYIHDMVPYLVKMANFKDSMDIRVIALKCLRKIVKFPTHMVLVEKPKVVASLKATLDDPKRLVRKEAVVTRNMWILTGAPGGL